MSMLHTEKFFKNSIDIEKFGFIWYNCNEHKNDQFEL